MEKIVYLLMVSLLLLFSCKKEKECPVIEEPYVSTMLGEVRTHIRVSIDSLNRRGEFCSGLFLNEVGNNNDFKYNVQAVEGMPDSLKIWDNYHEKEFWVDIEFIGVGYRCKYDDGLVEWLNGVPKVNMELVRVTHIEEAP